MFRPSAKDSDPSVLRKARAACYAARDQYYACAEEAGTEVSPEVVPVACRKLRAAYEASCRRTWVEHFDSQRQKEVRLLRAINASIRASGDQAHGTLAGKPLGDRGE
ncbi:unnamed protein product [Ostreobium quekettii]|uniref:Cytochrome c oxidase assembly factor 6 n=1 Tax=Ostreobium quekettii TaxID=121088 RepID=A0A8S1J1L5_9CHLO|nr:unnamed protein product [Ostreobium quekettii]|eukprot:evm.model.scf_577EXC.7 EVM.evm.TU.scf_577EXC.7   scf_577EXC:56158-56935(-)